MKNYYKKIKVVIAKNKKTNKLDLYIYGHFIKSVNTIDEAIEIVEQYKPGKKVIDDIHEMHSVLGDEFDEICSF